MSETDLLRQSSLASRCYASTRIYRLEPKRVRIVRVWRSERSLPRLGDEIE